jgi:hypothetical protein
VSSIPNDLEILAAAMNDPAAGRAQQCLEQRSEVDGTEAIDTRDYVGGRDLNQAKVWIVGALTNEFRIYRNQVGQRNRVAYFRERHCIGDKNFFTHGLLHTRIRFSA